MDGTTKIKEKCLILQSLKNKFEENIKQYHSELYDEANTRVDFIDKLFLLLDWDVSNEAGYAEQWREVVREDKVRIQGGQKALDYSFRIGGARQFLKDGELFNCVIGNPPYFNIQTLGAKSEIAQYIQNKYADIWQDKSDILFYFFAKAMLLSKDKIGFIVSNAFLFSDKGQKLRKKMINDGRLARIINFEEYPIFKGVGITTCITLSEKDKKDFKAISVKGRDYTLEKLIEYIEDEKNAYNVDLKEGEVFALVDSEEAKLNAKLDGKHKKLGELFKIGKGMETVADDVFCLMNILVNF